MNIAIVTLLVTNIISPIITGIISWVSAKKKYNTEVDANKIANLRNIIEVQEQQIKNLSERLNTTMERNKQLEAEVVELRKQMFNFMQSICLDFTCKHRKQENSNILDDRRYK